MSRIVQGSLVAAAVAVMATGCTFSASGKGSDSRTTGAGGSNSSAPGSEVDGGSSNGTSGGTGGGTGGGGGGTGGGSGRTPIGRCPAQVWNAKVQGIDGAAGSRSTVLVLTNVSGHACRVYGFPGLGLASPQNSAIPTSTRRQGTPQAFTVYPGGHAYTRLMWTVVPGGGESESGQCEPTPTALHVIPPDERVWVRASWNLGPVCYRGEFTVDPFTPTAPS
ncbi:DUF4232 domain-containing protein [Actinomadura harenae]|nr:DUF4232 domain-containing protein [Actinomadura harenae]